MQNREDQEIREGFRPAADAARDSDEASRALARIQQVLDEDREHPSGGDEKHSDSDKGGEYRLSLTAAMELRRILEPLHPADIAWILEALPVDDRLVVWELVKSESDGDILVEVNDGVRETLIEAMDRDELVDAVETLSDHRDLSLGTASGVAIKELRLLSRAVFVICANGVIAYEQIVKEVTHDVDFEAALGAVKACLEK